MSGISKEEAKSKLEAIYNEKKTAEIKIKHNEYESTISPELIETNYDIDKAVDEADNIGKSDNIFVNNYNILFTLIGKRNINVDMSINEDVAKQTIDDINVNLPDGVIESSYSVDDDELTISKGKAGVVIDENAFLEIIKYELKNIDSNGDQTLEIPVVNKEPEAIDIEKIHDEICKEPQDAYFTKNPFAVYPEVKGISFDLEKAKEVILSFKGLKYRMEYIGTYHDIKYYNDTIATIPDATENAVKAIKDVDTLIFGGLDRGIDYREFIEFLKDSTIKNLICMPSTGTKIGRILEEVSNKNIKYADNLEEANKLALQYTTPGMSCLLSPSAASYEYFKNFEEKGAAFEKIVKKM